MSQGRGRVLSLLFAVLVLLAVVAPTLAQQREVHGLDQADMDLQADPRLDFYRYANGGWLDRTVIPPDEGIYGVIAELRDDTTRQLIDLLSGLAAGNEGAKVGSDEWKALRLFEQGTDLKARNAQGLLPIQSTLAAIDSIADRDGLHQFLEESPFLGVSGLFSIVVYPDLADSTVNAAYLIGP
jgi:putative endopeptidase